MVKTSVEVNPKLWKEIKLFAVKHDMSLGEVLSEALTDWKNKKIQ